VSDARQPRSGLDAGVGRSIALDCVRGGAILAVIAVHSANTSWGLVGASGSSAPVYISVLRLGSYGVELFFLLSGWLLASLYDHDFNWGRFGLRRFARIWPLWVAFLLISIGESWILHAGAWHGLRGYHLGPPVSPVAAFVLTVIFVGGWVNGNLWVLVPGGWSIYCEVAHYTAYPLLRRASVGQLLTTLIGLRLIVEVFDWHYAPEIAAGKPLQLSPLLNGLPQAAAFFVSGMLAFRLLAAADRASQRAKLRSLASTLPGALLICLAAATYLRAETATLSVLVFLGIALALAASPLARPLAALGKVSYFVYFVHFLVLDAFAHVLSRRGVVRLLADVHLLSRAGNLLLCLALICAVTVVSYELGRISYRYFEGPINRWAHAATAAPASGAPQRSAT
jgi:peptidoglycan/LPS O-acetylase OafA/YrhL